MSLNTVDVQQFTNAYPVRWAIPPNQPIIGSMAIGAITTIFTYDFATPYGYGTFQSSNRGNLSSFMVAFGMVVRLSLIAPGAATLTIQVDIVGNDSFTEVDTSPVAIAANAKVQTITINPIPCSQLRARLTGDGSTYIYKVSATDY